MLHYLILSSTAFHFFKNKMKENHEEKFKLENSNNINIPTKILKKNVKYLQISDLQIYMLIHTPYPR